MLNWIIDFSLRHRFLVIAVALALAAVGAFSLGRLDIDAFPDTTPVQIQINTVAPSLSPEEVERQITFPVEQAISGLPGLDKVRSISKFGLSQVVVTFQDGTDIYFARQLVNERLGTVELPEGIQRPQMGPVSTGLGEVFHYVLTYEGYDFSKLSEEERIKKLTELRTIHDWVVKPQLRSDSRRGRSEQLGRLREAVPGSPRPRPAGQARPDVRPGCGGRQGEQPQRRRRKHHRGIADAAGPRPGPHGQPGADREHRHHRQGRRADPRRRRGRRADRPRNPPREP